MSRKPLNTEIVQPRKDKKMAIKIAGADYAIGQDTADAVTIDGVVGITSTTLNDGYQTNEPILGPDGNRKAIVFSSRAKIVQFSGYLKAGQAKRPKVGDACKIGQKDAAITSLSIAFAAGVTSVTGTAETVTESDDATPST